MACYSQFMICSRGRAIEKIFVGLKHGGEFGCVESGSVGGSL